VQTSLDQTQYFVASRDRLDPQLPAGDQLAQRFGVAGQPEEPVLLGDELRLGAVLGTSPVDQIVGGVELLAAHAVQAFVVLAIQIAGRVATLPEPLDADAMPRIAAGPDEVVERQLQRPSQVSERSRVAIDKVLYCDALGLGGEHVLQGVVVGACQQADVVTEVPAMSGQDVGLNQFEGESQVRACVDVRNGGGQEGTRHRCLHSERAET
jgi:hypothetical protein